MPKKKKSYHTMEGRITLGKVMLAAKEPIERRELIAATGLSVRTVAMCIRILRDTNRLHVHSYRGVGSTRRKLWIVGPGVDAKYARAKDLAADLPKTILAAMKAGITRNELGDLIGLGKTAATRRLRQAKAEHGMHISGWRAQHHQASAPIYMLGDGVDVPYVKQARNEYRTRVDGAPKKRVRKPVEYPDMVREVRVVKATTTGAVFRDPFSAALFGEYRGAAA